MSRVLAQRTFTASIEGSRIHKTSGVLVANWVGRSAILPATGGKAIGLWQFGKCKAFAVSCTQR